MKSRTILFLVILLTVAAAAFVLPQWLGNKVLPWRLGLDLIGGSHLIYEVDMSGVSASDKDSVLAGLRDVMERRVNVFGISEPQVLTAKSGDSYRILIELAGIKNAQEAIAHIGKTAQLEFREVEKIDEAEQKIIWKSSGLTGKYLKRAQVTFDSQIAQPEISIEFNSDGAKLFEEITGRNIEKPLAIFLDNELISSPIVRQKIIGGNAVISGQFSGDEAKEVGKPKTTREELLGYMDENGIKNPNSAYKLMFEDELKSWEKSQVDSLRKPGLETDGSSVAGSKAPNPVKVTKDNITEEIKYYFQNLKTLLFSKQPK